MKQDIQFITDLIVPETTSPTLDSYLTKPEIIPWEDVEKRYRGNVPEKKIQVYEDYLNAYEKKSRDVKKIYQWKLFEWSALCRSGMLIAGMGFLALALQHYEQWESIGRAILGFCFFTGFSELIFGLAYVKGKENIQLEYCESIQGISTKQRICNQQFVPLLRE